MIARTVEHICIVLSHFYACVLHMCNTGRTQYPCRGPRLERRIRGRYAGSMLVLILLALMADAESARPRPAAFAAAVACRDTRDAEARLACYDRTIAALDNAEREKRILIVDDAAYRRVQEKRFGAKVDRKPIMGDEVDRIASTLKAARVDDLGHWLFTLADGSRWLQTDDTPLVGKPRTGEAVIVRRGALGSFRLSVSGRSGVKVRRQAD
jgi:hypothetical protein